ncbi:hypothetical protein [Gordonia sp. HS-NH1]|uniref:hypothetical protein n=1 Tax=Gordonia sp. HS-NH1 TaxID=1435068 RepID=UPI0006E41996|nr:hypothetical protein [Gordonia sp. HS-NH1]
MTSAKYRLDADGNVMVREPPAPVESIALQTSIDRAYGAFAVQGRIDQAYLDTDGPAALSASDFAPHDPGYTHTLPTSAAARTGAGPVVTTVTVLREQYEGPPRPITIVPGLNALLVP